MTDLNVVSRIVVAALGGAAIGVERQRSGHASGRHPRLGGVRTFTLLGGMAGVAGHLSILGFRGFAVALAAGAVALVIAGYVSASRHDVDGTTEAAALVAIACGLLAGTGWMALASGIIAVTTLLLVEKSRLHALVRRIDDDELRAAVQFAVMAIVVLPLLPLGPFGPFGGIRPRALWLLVLFFTGLSFISYFARRLLGARSGYTLTGFLAGMISSTNATFTFARLSHAERSLSRALAIGTIASCTVLFPRVLVAALVLNATVARALLPYLIAPFAVGVVAFVVLLRGNERMARPHDDPPVNPLQIGPALQMAATFQVVLFGVDVVHRMAGDRGLLVSGGFLGIADVDALTISMIESVAKGAAPAIAAQAIALGICVNCVMKLGLATVWGSPQFRWTSGTVLAAMAVAIATAIVVVR